MIEPPGSPAVVRLDVFGSAGQMLVTNPTAPQRGTHLVVETSAGSDAIEVEHSSID